MQTSNNFFFSTSTSCRSNDCTRCIKLHGTCPMEADADSNASNTREAA